MGSILISFLYMLLNVAIVIFIAYAILFVLKWVGWAPDANVLKWGQIIVGLICLIIVVVWLVSVLGGVGTAPRPFWRW